MTENPSAPPPEPSVTDARQWPPETTISEVVAWVSKTFPTHLLLWVARMREKQYQNAYLECLNLRRVAARVEAYQRMVQRRGEKQEKKDVENHTRNPHGK